MNSLVQFWREFKIIKPPYIHPRDQKDCGNDPEFSHDERLDHRKFVKSDRFPDGGGFHLSLLPMPYVGDLDNADIVILLLNPGFNISNYETMQNPEYVKLSVKNLRQNFRGNDFPFMSLNPMLSTSAGFQWWHAKFAKVIKVISDEKNKSYLEAMSMVAKRVAAIEMVPYRSKSFKAGRLLDRLPSAIAAREYVQGELLKKAERNKVSVVVTRKAREWGLSSKHAVIYEGGHTRGAHLGPETAGGKAILRRFGISSR